jgi:pimeloyl-ACP methyl ester carboxylesterase
MRLLVFLILTFIFSTSCKNTYNYADYYSGHVLKKNGLHFHVANLDKCYISYWDTETDKPPLILIHGFGTSGNFQWFKESAALSENFRLIIVNLLYFGSKPKEPTYTVKGQIEAIQGLLEKLKLDSYLLCGASYGGLIAAEIALQNPEKVKKLVLLDTPLKFLTEEDTRNVCQKNGIDNPEELFVPSTPEMFKKLMSITYLKSPKMPKSMVRSFYKNTYQNEYENLRKMYQSYLEENKVFAMKSYYFKMPVLLIWGEEDRLVPLHVGKELKNHIGQNARLETVPNAAHLPNLENEKAVNKLLLSFLKSES